MEFMKYIPYDSEARVMNWILKRFLGRSFGQSLCYESL